LLSLRLRVSRERKARGLKGAILSPGLPAYRPLRVNNGDAMMPALIAGSGLGILPEFILRDALAASRLERLLPDWSIPLGAVYWLTPPAGPRPKRVEILGDFLIEKLARHTKRKGRAAPAGMPRPAGKTKRP
jgi:DNA-binding transcriptional LysR family regulator